MSLAQLSAAWETFRCREIGFTLWNISFFFIAVISRQPSLLAISYCCCFGVVTSFHLGWIVDPSGIERLMKRNNLPTGIEFQFYNALVHLAPLAVVVYVCHSNSVPVESHHGLWAVALHLTWGLAETRGHLLLDQIYVEMDAWHWYVMWTTAFLSEALAPRLL